MKAHTKHFITHIGSLNDEFIPVSHFRKIKEELDLNDAKETGAMLSSIKVPTYYEFPDKGHFITHRSKEIEEVVMTTLKA